MIRFNKTFIFITLFNLILCFSCADSWDERLADHAGMVDKNLIQVIRETDNLGKFYEYLVRTGYDKELESSKSFTVWAPSDAALAVLDPGIVDDTEELKHVIGFFISLSSDGSGKGIFRQKMMNGKYAGIDKDAKIIEGATIMENSDVICKNGILHTIDKAYLPKINAWECLFQIAEETVQTEYINKLFAWVFDKENSLPIGVDEYTGMTIYDTVKIWKNIYLMNIADLESEDELYTFFILSDNAFNDAQINYKSYYKPADTLLIDSIASYNVCADLVLKGRFYPENLPSNPISTTNITLNISSSIIDSVYETSNGIVYFLNSPPVTETNKFVPIIIEGENPDSALSNLWIVRRVDEASAKHDLFYDNKVASSWVQYDAHISYPARYNFYWVAVTNPVQTDMQKLSIYNYKPDKEAKPFHEFPYVFSTTTYATEMLIGSYTFNEATSITLRVFSEDNATALPPLSLDYIKILPVK